MNGPIVLVWTPPGILEETLATIERHGFRPMPAPTQGDLKWLPVADVLFVVPSADDFPAGIVKRATQACIPMCDSIGSLCKMFGRLPEGHKDAICGYSVK